MTDFNPTEEQKQNLLKLAEVLETALPTAEGYSFEFDMGWYFYDLDKDGPYGGYTNHLHNQCNASACAIGVGVLAGIGDTSTHFVSDYADNTFGTNDRNTSEGRYMFNSLWEDVDNTPEGAAARIRYILEHGLPEDWEDQMYGNAPLSYE